jgi:hypothetical protein
MTPDGQLSVNDERRDEVLRKSHNNQPLSILEPALPVAIHHHDHG